MHDFLFFPVRVPVGAAAAAAPRAGDKTVLLSPVLRPFQRVVTTRTDCMQSTRRPLRLDLEGATLVDGLPIPAHSFTYIMFLILSSTSPVLEPRLCISTAP